MIYTLLIIVIIALCYVIYNLLKKVETLEERVLSKTEDIELLLSKFQEISNKMQEIDNKKIFESDDEVGVTFDMLNKLIQDNTFLLDYYTKEDDRSSGTSTR
jgi:predicted Holliday junction resolvase-like endonuclease